MTIIEIENIESISVIEQLNNTLKGTVKNIDGEEILEFDNNFGNGIIRNVSCNWGISLLDYNVFFNKNVKIIFNTKNETPVEFLFVSKGQLEFGIEDKNFVVLERFQNIVLSNVSNSKNIFVFPEKINVKLNTIQVVFEEYKKKKNNNLHSLDTTLRSLAIGKAHHFPYQHLGGHSLKIAGLIKKLNSIRGSSFIKLLSIEGQLHLILAMQIAEHKNFIDNNVIPDSLSHSDIKKIHDIANYIVKHIAQHISIKTLSSLFGLTPKKLQSGFKLLYSKSVNEYIRHTKLEIARDLIKNTDESISEIVYSIGYRSRSYFSKIFYDTYEILPTEYRESIKRGLQTKAE